MNKGQFLIWGVVLGAVSCGWGIKDVVVNGGFETRALAPWVSATMSISNIGQRSGSYWAYYLTQTDGGAACGPACDGDGEQAV